MPLVALSFALARRFEKGRALGDRTTTDLVVQFLGLGRDVAMGKRLRTLFAIGLLDRLATRGFARFCSDRAAGPAGTVSDLPGLFG